MIQTFHILYEYLNEIYYFQSTLQVTKLVKKWNEIFCAPSGVTTLAAPYLPSTFLFISLTHRLPDCTSSLWPIRSGSTLSVLFQFPSCSGIVLISFLSATSHFSSPVPTLFSPVPAHGLLPFAFGSRTAAVCYAIWYSVRWHQLSINYALSVISIIHTKNVSKTFAKIITK